MRIDSHHSFSERYPLGYLESILKRNRFDAGILVGEAFWPAQEFVKGVIVRTGRLDPRDLDEYQRQPKFRGICYEPAVGEVPAGFAELERRAIPLDLVSGLELLPRIAEKFPRLRIALDHLGAPFSGDWAQRLAAAAQYPNVFCKLSGLTRIAPSPVPYVRHALAVFGPAPADVRQRLAEHAARALVESGPGRIYTGDRRADGRSPGGVAGWHGSPFLCALRG